MRNDIILIANYDVNGTKNTKLFEISEMNTYMITEEDIIKYLTMNFYSDKISVLDKMIYLSLLNTMAGKNDDIYFNINDIIFDDDSNDKVYEISNKYYRVFRFYDEKDRDLFVDKNENDNKEIICKRFYIKWNIEEMRNNCRFFIEETKESVFGITTGQRQIIIMQTYNMNILDFYKMRNTNIGNVIFN